MRRWKMLKNAWTGPTDDVPEDVVAELDPVTAKYQGLVMAGYPACDGTYLAAICECDS
jgi:hypothetical protein